MLIWLPSTKDFQDGQHFKMMFEFLMNYVVKLYGVARMRSSMEDNPGCRPMDMVTTSDFAYVITILENKRLVWQQQVQLARMTEEERSRFKESDEYQEEVAKFTSRKGKRYKYLSSGWTEKGKMFYGDVWRRWKNKFKNEEFCSMMGVAWEEYENDSDTIKLWKKR